MKLIAASSLVLLAAGLAAFAPANPAPTAEVAPAAANSYDVDSVHSFVNFRCKHFNTSFAYGRFDKVSGTISWDSSKPEAGSLNIEVATDSVSTGNIKRDGHLKSGDFFNASEFPKATFKSKSFTKTGENTFDVKGDFTLRGTTKEITVKLEKTGEGKGQAGPIIGFETTFTIDRIDFGVKYMPDALGKEVRITVALEAVQG